MGYQPRMRAKDWWGVVVSIVVLVVGLVYALAKEIQWWRTTDAIVTPPQNGGTP